MMIEVVMLKVLVIIMITQDQEYVALMEMIVHKLVFNVLLLVMGVVHQDLVIVMHVLLIIMMMTVKC